ncbi:MAG: hypothetical protein K2I18_07675 [Paramuribaculum sp.]|nr:hypothetical protein [Paramuribaculum sp.]
MRKVILIATVALLGTAWSMLNFQPTQESRCERNNVEAVSDNELPPVEITCCASPMVGNGQCWDEVVDRDGIMVGCRYRGNINFHCMGEIYQE